jgi:hypothetical protein
MCIDDTPQDLIVLGQLPQPRQKIQVGTGRLVAGGVIRCDRFVIIGRTGRIWIPSTPSALRFDWCYLGLIHVQLPTDSIFVGSILVVDRRVPPDTLRR